MPIAAHVAWARVCPQLYVLRASHALVQATVGVGTVIISYIGVAYTRGGGHTRRDKGEHSRQGGGAQRGRRGNQNSGNREPEWRGWESVRMGGSDIKGDGLASQPRRYRVPGQPLLNRHQVGGVSRSPDGLFAQQEREPTRGRPAVRGKRTYGGRPGQRMEEQGTWVSHTETQQGRLWTACGQRRVDSKNSQTTPATTSTSLIHQLLGAADAQTAQPQHTNYWAPRTRKRHQREHRPQRPTERSDPMQHVKGRTGDCPGPVKEHQPDGMSHRGYKRVRSRRHRERTTNCL